MMKLSLSFGRWKKLKNVLDFSESKFKNSCIGNLTVRLNSINYIFASKKYLRYLKTCLEWSIYAKHK